MIPGTSEFVTPRSFSGFQIRPGAEFPDTEAWMFTNIFDPEFRDAYTTGISTGQFKITQSTTDVVATPSGVIVAELQYDDIASEIVEVSRDLWPKTLTDPERSIFETDSNVITYLEEILEDL